MNRVFKEGMKFENVDFREKSLEMGDYETCIFSNCNFSNSDLSDINFLDCEFTGWSGKLLPLSKLKELNICFNILPSGRYIVNIIIP